MNILSNFDLLALGHNSPGYLHALMSALNLAFADRRPSSATPNSWTCRLTACFPKNTPQGRRSGSIWTAPSPTCPNPETLGAPGGRASLAVRRRAPRSPERPRPIPARHFLLHGGGFGGKRFSCTPSDPANAMPFVPGVGATVSGRGSQSWLDPAHPSLPGALEAAQAHAEPRPHAHRRRVLHDAGHAGGDVQPQAMLQVFLNHVLFDMPPQMAIEAPRPPPPFPQLLLAPRLRTRKRAGGGAAFERRRPRARRDGLQDGLVPDFSWPPGSVCAIVKDPGTGFLLAGADPRRESYAVGW